MLKVKTLKPKKDPMVKYIKASPVSEVDIAKCFGLSQSYFNTKLSQGLNKQDEIKVKNVVDKLSKRNDK